MATMMATNDNVRMLEVVHPLDDAPEAKCSPDNLGRMHMSRSVKLALFSLRAYLIGMAGLVAYRVLSLALGHPA